MMLHVLRGLWSCTCMLVVLVTFAVSDVTGNLCPLCDCLVRDLGMEGGAVATIIMGCQEGKVTWYTSHGDLRMILKPVKEGLFRFCIRVDSDITTVVSREINLTTPANYRRKKGAQTETKLSPLFTSKGRSKEYCISGSGPVQLYMQTERSENGAPKVRIHYDMEKLSNQIHHSSFEGCRPCTDQELLRSVCSSDFVAIGKIDDVTHDEDTSHIRLSVSRVITQKEAIFMKQADGTEELKGVVHVPLRCGIRHGEGQFMFTGRVRLGQPVLQCAPRYEQWKQVLANAVANDLLECSLDL